ncbi:BC1872 family protein [Paenibacillus larvae]|uniref:BC1872 family protein n=1 Tax=Paenibacillus larvae TaxID=1464 RepID=UPI0037C893BC
MADAWRVLEKLRGKWFVRIADFGRHGWGVELVSETASIPYVSVTRETAPEAICVAALIAVLTGEEGE